MAMIITTSAQRFHDELVKWLTEQANKKADIILSGSCTETYKERCAELRIYQAVLAEIPEALKRAKE